MYLFKVLSWGSHALEKVIKRKQVPDTALIMVLYPNLNSTQSIHDADAYKDVERHHEDWK